MLQDRPPHTSQAEVATGDSSQIARPPIFASELEKYRIVAPGKSGYQAARNLNLMEKLQLARTAEITLELAVKLRLIPLQNNDTPMLTVSTLRDIEDPNRRLEVVHEAISERLRDESFYKGIMGELSKSEVCHPSSMFDFRRPICELTPSREPNRAIRNYHLMHNLLAARAGRK